MQLFEYNQVTCLHPRVIRNHYTRELISVPCGRCSVCQNRAQSLWLARCCEESTCHTYTLFGTLTYTDEHLTYVDIDNLDESFYTDKMIQAIKDSKDYIDFCHGHIPICPVKDIQNFFKRLRSIITYYHGTQEKIRYFVVADYGCTTIRPHWHFLLWFDSHEVAKVIKEYIYKAWKPNTNLESLSSFLRRNKQRFVHGKAEQYVAGYVNRFSHLPSIFSCKPFRPFHLQSSAPPIGTIRILKESLSALQSGDITKVCLHRQSSGRTVLLPLWRGMENRFFPRCFGYDKLNASGRNALYNLYAFCFRENGQEPTFKFFLQWFDTLRTNYAFAKEIFESIFFSCHPKEEYFGQVYLSSLQRCFNASRLVFKLAQQVGLSVSDYVCRIESYYQRKNYDALCVQLKFQESISNNPRNDVDLRYYPFIVDSLFYNNLREIGSYQEYLVQFNLVKFDPCCFVPEFSVPWLQKRAFNDKVLADGTKKKLNKEYIATHPECYQNYKSLLRPISLTS